MEHCTFKPNLIAKDKQYMRQNRSNSNFYERNQHWLDQVNTKIEKEIKKEDNKMKKICKFKPNINPSEKSFTNIKGPHEFSDTEVKGLNNHLARIMQAKQ